MKPISAGNTSTLINLIGSNMAIEHVENQKIKNQIKK